MLGTDRVTGNIFQGSIADCTKMVHLESESWAHRMSLIILLLGDRLIQALLQSNEEKES